MCLYPFFFLFLIIPAGVGRWKIVVIAAKRLVEAVEEVQRPLPFMENKPAVRHTECSVAFHKQRIQKRHVLRLRNSEDVQLAPDKSQVLASVCYGIVDDCRFGFGVHHNLLVYTGAYLLDHPTDDKHNLAVDLLILSLLLEGLQLFFGVEQLVIIERCFFQCLIVRELTKLEFRINGLAGNSEQGFGFLIFRNGIVEERTVLKRLPREQAVQIIEQIAADRRAIRNAADIHKLLVDDHDPGFPDPRLIIIGHKHGLLSGDVVHGGNFFITAGVALVVNLHLVFPERQLRSKTCFNHFACIIHTVAATVRDPHISRHAVIRWLHHNRILHINFITLTGHRFFEIQVKVRSCSLIAGIERFDIGQVDCQIFHITAVQLFRRNSIDIGRSRFTNRRQQDEIRFIGLILGFDALILDTLHLRPGLRAACRDHIFLGGWPRTAFRHDHE
ncbi:hypothetical protein D3C76_257510 [compost metagenome]